MTRASWGRIRGSRSLPFLDLSQDRSKAYFCEGVAEEIISVLGTAEGLRVTPRTTAFALSEAGVKVGEVARRLGVTHLVEGSAKFKGSRYQVTVRLLDTRLETPVWQDQFNGSLETSDAFDLDENVATCVLDALRTRLPSAVPLQEKPRSEEEPPPAFRAAPGDAGATDGSGRVCGLPEGATRLVRPYGPRSPGSSRDLR